MKKLLLFGFMMLLAASAFAAEAKPVKCDVNGATKTVKTEQACKDLGGKVVAPKKA